MVNENAHLESELLDYNNKLEDAKDELAKKDYESQSLKDQLAKAGGGRAGNIDTEVLVNLACQKSPPSPSDCIDVIKRLYGDKCIFLESAKKSAQDMNRFTNGRELLDMLKRLVTVYQSALIEGGDNRARAIFGKNEYAAKKSETVMQNTAMRRARTFEYRNKQIEMFRHIKIGIDHDVAKTIRVHFHWDGERQNIVIGYCGKHLPVSAN